MGPDRAGAGPHGAGVQVLPLRGAGPLLSIVAGDGSARAVIWPGMGAVHRSIHLIRLAPSSGTIRLTHPAESVYYIVAGSGTVAGESPSGATRLGPGSMVHVAPGTGYRFAAGASGLEIFGGPCPYDPAAYGAAGDWPGPACDAPADRGAPAASPRIQVFHQDKPALMLPLISADARMIVWPGVGAWTATMNYVRMQRGEENKAHTHQESEDTIVILEGRGSIDDLTHGKTHEFRAGDVIHVPVKLRHAVRANRGENVVSVGGPCPADLPFLRLCGAEIPDRDAALPGRQPPHGVP